MAIKRSRSLLIVIGVIVIILAAWLLIAHANHYWPYHKPKVVVTASQYTKGEPKTNATGPAITGRGTNQPVTSEESPGGQKSTAPSSNSAILVAPSGNFVSNHKPNLSGTPAPNTLSSVCSTTPGATCQITFTMGATVKSLPAQTVDAGGATYWNWRLQDYGLSAGTWQITAIAKLNNQTETAKDPTNLTVSP